MCCGWTKQDWDFILGHSRKPPLTPVVHHCCDFCFNSPSTGNCDFPWCEKKCDPLQVFADELNLPALDWIVRSMAAWTAAVSFVVSNTKCQEISDMIKLCPLRTSPISGCKHQICIQVECCVFLNHHDLSFTTFWASWIKNKSHTEHAANSYLSKYVISGIMHRRGIYLELLAFAKVTVVFSSTAKLQKITL